MKKNKVRYILISIIVILCLLLLLYMINTFKKNKKIINNESLVETISNYNYSLSSDDTEIYKTNFKELKTILEANPIDEKKYAETISKLFIIDFYTLDNKINNKDVGGLIFVHSSIVDNFKLKAEDTIYKYLESNIYKDRTQKLPVVKDVSIDSIELVSYTYNNTKDKNAYKVKLSITYEEDLGYEKNKTLYFVHEENKLSLVEME